MVSAINYDTTQRHDHNELTYNYGKVVTILCTICGRIMSGF